MALHWPFKAAKFKVTCKCTSRHPCVVTESNFHVAQVLVLIMFLKFVICFKKSYEKLKVPLLVHLMEHREWVIMLDHVRIGGPRLLANFREWGPK
jgi:hypothetical protein